MASPANTWRDRVKVHPAADMFPMLADDELLSLGKDIAENGLRHPATFWTPTKTTSETVSPDQIFLLDGRNRLAAIERAFPDDLERAAALDRALRIGPDGARLLTGEGDPWAFVISANIHRRHLNREQKRELIERLLKAKPERSDRETAKLAKASPTTLGKIRARLEQAGDVSTMDTHTDSKGRQQPATKRPREQQPSKEAQLRALREQRAANNTGIATPASPGRYRVADELLQVARMLQGDLGRIDQIPLAKRVALARGCLVALNVTFDDLRPIGDAP